MLGTDCFAKVVSHIDCVALRANATRREIDQTANQVAQRLVEIEQAFEAYFLKEGEVVGVKFT